MKASKDKTKGVTFPNSTPGHHHAHQYTQRQGYKAEKIVTYSENLLSHPGKSHLSGLSPVWTLLCIVMAEPCANSFPHI